MTIRQSRPEQSSGNDSGPSRGGRDYARLRYKYLIKFISIASTFNDIRWVAFKSVAQSDGIASSCPSPKSPLPAGRSEEHTSELQSLMRISYAVFCLKKKKDKTITTHQLYRHYYITTTDTH